ncbi:hypothetical protein L2E82_43927 [Cichorium intybus]|uniref:Uncharacterized protein n=1 Tax=Cichorium intybus TaxID=13427 RepID=A0ACB8ZPF6_CICIN|nr:hypothetical protein L2E82_43927 [Cichorium intybus]
MAGKSSRGRNRKGAQNAPNATEQAVSNGHSKDNVNTVEESKADANGIPTSAEIHDTKPEVRESKNASSENHAKQDGPFGDILKSAQEGIILPPYVAITVRPRPGVWEFLRINIHELSVEQLSVSEYIMFKEERVDGQ